MVHLYQWDKFTNSDEGDDAMARIQYQKGDIFESEAQVIVNTVNCKGIMGKGLALAFKERYPDMFAAYQADCKSGKLRIGRPTLYKKSSPWILNFPTKDHWRFPSKLEYLEKGLEFLVAHYQKVGITSIAFPKLGAQNGKLSWDEVGPLMAKYLSQLDVDVYIFIAEGDREYQYDPIQDSKVQEQIWAAFSQLVLSVDRLTQEVGLSHAQAVRVAAQRLQNEFHSLADVECIDKLARISLKKIKDYINHQRLTALELPGFRDRDSSHKTKVPTNSTKPSKTRRAKPKMKTSVSSELLIPESSLAS